MRRREVRRARLGFSAERSSEAVGVPEAVGTTVQEESVTVHVRRAGALDVTLSGVKTAAVDAAPVAGTASSGGKVSGRAVRWRVASAKRGRHTFTARFRVAADPSTVGSYATEAVVRRAERTTTLLDHAGGAQAAGRRVMRLSTLTFAGRVAPPYGPPRAQAHSWSAAKDTAGLADVFAGAVSLDAYGDYVAGASGVAGGLSTVDLRKVAPGAVGKNLSGSMTYSGWGGFVEDKFTSNGVFLYDDETDELSGFGIALCAERPGNGYGVTGGVLYDRDAATAPAVADVFALQAKRKGPPRNRSGRLKVDWSGRLVSAWSAFSGRYTLDQDPVRHSEFVHGASIGWVVAGGDLDNRKGSVPMRAKPVVIRAPKGEQLTSVFMGTSILPNTEFRPSLDVDDDGVVSIGGAVNEGGYWLRSTRRGYDRDWTTASSLFMSAVPAGGEPTTGAGAVTSLRLVPPGTNTVIQYAVPGRPVRSALLGPGVWRVTGVAGDLRVQALQANDTSGCTSGY